MINDEDFLPTVLKIITVKFIGQKFSILPQWFQQIGTDINPDGLL